MINSYFIAWLNLSNCSTYVLLLVHRPVASHRVSQDTFHHSLIETLTSPSCPNTQPSSLPLPVLTLTRPTSPALTLTVLTPPALITLVRPYPTCLNTHPSRSPCPNTHLPHSTCLNTHLSS